MTAKQYAQAIADYTNVIEGNPANAEAYYNRGKAYSGLGNKAMAEEDMNKARQLGHAGPFSVIGTACRFRLQPSGGFV